MILLIQMTLLLYTCKRDETSCPIIETVDVSNITASSATIKINIINIGEAPIESIGLYWILKYNEMSRDTIINIDVGIGEFTCRIYGLLPSNSYIVGSLARNSFGVGYGNRLEFNSSDSVSKYIIEVDNEYRFSKVSSEYWIKTYFYSDTIVIITQTSSIPGYLNNKETYFLNNLGLADSSFNGSFYNYYSYNSDNYLISSISSGKKVVYEYLNGNRTGIFVGPPEWLRYEYNSLQNIIDIESFTGSWLGQLNKNLISKKSYRWGPMGGDVNNTDYDYVLNEDGLVVQRIALKTENWGIIPPIQTIENFEYLFVEIP
jgi:hypothetical protein